MSEVAESTKYRSVGAQYDDGQFAWTLHGCMCDLATCDPAWVADRKVRPIVLPFLTILTRML